MGDEDGNGTVEIEEFFVFFDTANGFKEMQQEVRAVQTVSDRTWQVQKGSSLFSLLSAVIFFSLIPSGILDVPILGFLGGVMLLVSLAFFVMAYGIQIFIQCFENILLRCNYRRFG